MTKTLTVEETDRIAAHWVTHYAPSRATNSLVAGPIPILVRDPISAHFSYFSLLLLQRTAMTAEEMGRVRVPVQILHVNR